MLQIADMLLQVLTDYQTEIINEYENLHNAPEEVKNIQAALLQAWCTIDQIEKGD